MTAPSLFRPVVRTSGARSGAPDASVSGTGDAGECLVAGVGQILAHQGERVTEALQRGDGEILVSAFDDEVKKLLQRTNKFLDGEFNHFCCLFNLVKPGLYYLI
jgi:hypothetical protein